MATSVDYIEFACEQMVGTGAVRYRKMFGEYMIYVNDKPLFLVCDNTVFVKKIPELEEVMKDAECGIPYEGCKEQYVLDIEDRELCKTVVSIVEPLKKVPKPRTKRAKLEAGL